MKHKNLLLTLPFVFWTFAGISLSSCKDTPVRKLYKSDIDWRLTWQDEFEKDGTPDPEKWVFSPWHPFCRDNNFVTFVKDGKLILRALPNSDPNDTIRYMAGCVETLGKKDFLYGRFEVCAKLGSAKGSWPAIWLKPTDSTTYGAWPKCGEIDIMEQLNKDTFVYHTMHTEYIKVLGHKTDPDYYTTASYNPHEFNVFGMEWTPDKIDMFINDSLTFSYPRIKEEGSVQWPFDVPFFLLLNQILGGWAGEIDDAELPVQMEVDWVRYYELPKNMR